MGAAVYTNCPAMCLLDLLTNTRYGLGNHITDSNLDLFSFVAASKYANEEVDDGTGSGGKEARFSCNVNIQTPKEAFAAIKRIIWSDEMYANMVCWKYNSIDKIKEHQLVIYLI